MDGRIQYTRSYWLKVLMMALPYLRQERKDSQYVIRAMPHYIYLNFPKVNTNSLDIM